MTQQLFFFIIIVVILSVFSFVLLDMCRSIAHAQMLPIMCMGKGEGKADATSLGCDTATCFAPELS